MPNGRCRVTQLFFSSSSLSKCNRASGCYSTTMQCLITSTSGKKQLFILAPKDCRYSCLPYLKHSTHEHVHLSRFAEKATCIFSEGNRPGVGCHKRLTWQLAGRGVFCLVFTKQMKTTGFFDWQPRVQPLYLLVAPYPLSSVAPWMTFTVTSPDDVSVSVVSCWIDPVVTFSSSISRVP